MKKYFFLLVSFCICINIYANERLIIKYKETKAQQKLINSGAMTPKQIRQQMMLPLSSNTITKLRTYAGVPVVEVNQIATGAHVIDLQGNLTESKVNTIIQKIKSDPAIEYVEVDQILKPMAMPSYNPKQWDMVESINGDNFQSLQTTWANDPSLAGISPGNGVIVAVIDTGYTPHINFIDNLVPLTGELCSSSNGKGTTCYGYTFISDCAISGDPTCNKSPQPYKPDALDWGDYTTVNNVTSKSSWHGSHVAGIIAADGYISTSGILGSAYGAKVLPVRALGRGGGYTSDVISAILWASGEGTIYNHTPANVINMSLGGPGSCGPAMQAAINLAISNNVIVVAAAGNASCSGKFCSSYTVYNVSQVTPASCNGVISVSAKGIDNNLSWYSSYGNTTITASGGNVYPSITESANVYSDIWNSPYAYESQGSPIYTWYEGTSQATPHVSGAVADLISYFKQKGVAYSTPYIIGVLQNSASNLTNSSNYSAKPTTQGQGGSVSGLTLNANNALLYAQTLVSAHIVVAPSSWSPTSTTSQMFTFTNESSESVAIESYLISGNDKSVVITASNNTCIGKTLAPHESCSILLTLVSQGVSYNSLQLFSNAGKVVALVPINVNNPAPAAPASSGGGGGGCSAINSGNDYSLIFILLGLSILYIFRKRCNYK